MTIGVKLNVLGAFSLSTGDSVIDLPAGKGQALLAYLALNPDQRHARSKLATLLWGNHNDKHARNNLSQSLFRLRRALGDNADIILNSDKEIVRLNGNRITVDALSLKQLAASDTPEALNAAAALCRGPLLEAFATREEVFEDWLTSEREAVAKLMDDVLTRRVMNQLTMNDADGAIDTARQLLAMNELNEEAHRLLMRAYAANGQRHSALQQYRACCDVLRREFDVEPDAATRSLYDEMQGDQAGNGDQENEDYPRLPDKPSIAVLPFRNMSGDPEHEFIGNGIADDIITALSKFRWFFVIAPSSSSTYTAKSVDVRQVARELGVRYVLEGSVRKANNRVRISAQLIDATTGIHIWAESYDRKFDDIFVLQDEMTAMIVGAIEPELGDAESARVKSKVPNSLDAWEYNQRGLWHVYRINLDDINEAETHFLNAIKLDPKFSSAYAGLTLVRIHQVNNGWTATPEKTVERALQSAQQAVNLDDKDAFAHFVLGRVYTMKGEIETGIVEMEQALELNPNLSAALYGLGFALAWSGRPQDALPLFYKVLRQSPRAPFRWHFENMIGVVHMLLKEHKIAVEWCRKASRYHTSGWWPHVNLAIALAELDRKSEARAALRAAKRLRPNLSQAIVAETMFRQMQPNLRQIYLAKLREAGLPE